MNTSAGLLNFHSQGPKEIIFELFRIRKRILLGETLEMPQVTLLVWPDGNQVMGFILDMKSEKFDHHIAVQFGSVQESSNIFYTHLGAVRGIVVHDIDRYEHLLTEVTAETHMNRPPVFTKLDVRKRLDTESKNLSATVKATIAYQWQGELPEQAMPLFIIGNLITDVTMCLKDIAQTDLGLEAIATEINTITFDKTDAEFSVERKGKELMLSGTFRKSFTTNQGRWQLKDKLESLL